jgi:hypothetical protein
MLAIDAAPASQQVAVFDGHQAPVLFSPVRGLCRAAMKPGIGYGIPDEASYHMVGIGCVCDRRAVRSERSGG